MDREIQFRGKRNGEWIYGDLIHLSPTDKTTCMIVPKGLILHSPYTNPFTVDYKTVGQFTGRKDKNGKKIFEGDIVRTKIDVGFVRYNAKQWFFEVAQIEEPLDNERKCGGIPEEDWEVIGNIHENISYLKKNR